MAATPRSDRVPAVLYWQLIDQLRGAGFLDRFSMGLEIVRRAVAAGLIDDWRDLSSLLSGDRTSPDIVDPTFVSDTIVALVSDGHPLRVLDPWAGLGLTLRALDEVGQVSHGVGIEINASVEQLASEVFPSPRLEWMLGDASRLLPGLVGQFDLVVGSPPLGLPQGRFDDEARQIQVKASSTYVMLLQAALVLADAGVMAVVLPDGFFQPPNEPVRSALEGLGLHLSAALALPFAMFTSTSIPLSLLVFTKRTSGSIFVAQLDQGVDPKAALDNYRAGKEGAVPELGRWVPRDLAASPRQYLARLTTAEQARRAGLHAVRAADACSRIRGPSRGTTPFTHDPNSVYLPKIGVSPAVTAPERMAIKPQNYMQLVIDTEVGDPEYVAAFFNSQLGRRVRQQAMSGAIPQLSAAQLRDIDLYLPPTRAQQRTAVSLGRKLHDLHLSVQALEDQLWDRPLTASKVEGQLARLLEGDAVSSWMETLPFPLASVLWRWQASDDAERRSRYLVNFFEALTVFVVDLQVSALSRDAAVMHEIARQDPVPAVYDRGSIGIWADLLARVASKTRQLLEHEQSTALDLFALSDVSRLASVSSRDLVGALRTEAADYRRNWIGHAAVVGPSEWERRQAQAEATLGRIREAIGDAFIGWELVRAGSGRNRDGVVTTSVERLTGSRSLFRQDTIQLRQWPEDGCLYMLERDAGLVLKLASLFRLRRSPESVEDAAYFYDRIEKDGIRWISYAYESAPEVVEPDADTIALIKQLDLLG